MATSGNFRHNVPDMPNPYTGMNRRDESYRTVHSEQIYIKYCKSYVYFSVYLFSKYFTKCLMAANGNQRQLVATFDN